MWSVQYVSMAGLAYSGFWNWIHTLLPSRSALLPLWDKIYFFVTFRNSKRPWEHCLLCDLLHELLGFWVSPFFWWWLMEVLNFSFNEPVFCGTVSPYKVIISVLGLLYVASPNGFWNISNWRRLLCQYVTIVRVAPCTCNFESNFHNAL